ncbi:MAG: hypothetical protein ABSB86_13065 [Bryobacteraceae bacterium]
MIIGYLIPCIAVDQAGNLFWRQFFTIAFSVDQIDSSHFKHFSVPSYVFESKGLDQRGAARVSLIAAAGALRLDFGDRGAAQWSHFKE